MRAVPISLLVMNPVAPRPKPATYPGGGLPKLGFLGAHLYAISYKLKLVYIIKCKENMKLMIANILQILSYPKFPSLYFHNIMNNFNRFIKGIIDCCCCRCLLTNKASVVKQNAQQIVKQDQQFTERQKQYQQNTSEFHIFQQLVKRRYISLDAQQEMPKQVIQLSQQVRMSKYYKQDYQIKFKINQQWSRQLRQNKKQVRNRIIEELHKSFKQDISIVQVIKNSWKRTLKSIRNQYFIVNIDLFQLLIRSDESIEDMSSQTYQNQQLFEKPKIFRNLKSALLLQYELLLKDKKQKQEIFQQIKKSCSQLENQIKISKLSNRSLFSIKQFLTRHTIQQFLYAFRYILAQYQLITQKRYYNHLLSTWKILMKDVQKKHNIADLDIIIERFCIQNAKPLSQEEYKESLNQSIHEHQSSQSNIQSQSQSRSRKQESSRQSEQQDQLFDSNQSFATNKYIKLYTTKRETTSLYVKFIKSLEYIKLQNKTQQKKYRLKFLTEQNQMNMIRYLNDKKLDCVAQLSISKDTNPENEPMIKGDPSQSKLCFQFYINKGDKDYSLLYKQIEVTQFTRKNLWGYQDKKIIYSFLKHFAYCIYTFQKHHIHQTDFHFQNFIKLGKTFLSIDFGSTFFVKQIEQFEKYFNLNKQIFSCWLNSAQMEFSLTSTSSQYQIFRLRLNNNKNKKQLKNIIDSCLNSMEARMIQNHKKQFYDISHNLLSEQAPKHQGFPISPQQINAIISKLPNNYPNEEFSYVMFIQQLQKIYKKFNQNIYPLSIRHNFQGFSANLIGKQFTLVSSFFKHQPVSSINDKIIKRIQLITYENPLQNVCTYDKQNWHSKEDMLLSSLENDSPIDFSNFSNPIYSTHFIISLMNLIKQLQDKGYLLLRAQIDWFTQCGSRFFLKNISSLLKISSNNHQEKQLIKLSCYGIQKILDLDSNQQACEQINKKIKHQYQSCFINAEQDNQEKIKTFCQFLKEASKKIHYEHFLRLANKILQYSPQDKMITVRDLLGSMQEENYLSLIEKLPSIVDQQY